MPAQRITDAFNRARSQRSAALILYLTGGYPPDTSTASLISALDSAGADLIEIGFPFTDPIADGPVIAEAMNIALGRGATPQRIFSDVRSARPTTQAGLIAMVSASIVHRLGVDHFMRTAADAGFDGVIVPDLDDLAASEWSQLAVEADLAFVPLIAPTTSPSRIASLCANARGFVYVLARVGITGSATAPPSDHAALIARIREHTSLPLALGFGISTPEHVRSAASIADGVIVGTALVQRLSNTADPASAASEFARALKPATLQS